MTKRHGLGQGDLELLAFIGSFLGIIGTWFTLLIGSLLGSLFGISYWIVQRKINRNLKIPFGPFLALSAIIFVLFRNAILSILLYNIQ